MQEEYRQRTSKDGTIKKILQKHVNDPGLVSDLKSRIIKMLQYRLELLEKRIKKRLNKRGGTDFAQMYAKRKRYALTDKKIPELNKMALTLKQKRALLNTGVEEHNENIQKLEQRLDQERNPENQRKIRQQIRNQQKQKDKKLNVLMTFDKSFEQQMVSEKQKIIGQYVQQGLSPFEASQRLNQTINELNLKELQELQDSVEQQVEEQKEDPEQEQEEDPGQEQQQFSTIPQESGQFLFQTEDIPGLQTQRIDFGESNIKSGFTSQKTSKRQDFSEIQETRKQSQGFDYSDFKQSLRNLVQIYKMLPRTLNSFYSDKNEVPENFYDTIYVNKDNEKIQYTLENAVLKQKLQEYIQSDIGVPSTICPFYQGPGQEQSKESEEQEYGDLLIQKNVSSSGVHFVFSNQDIQFLEALCQQAFGFLFGGKQFMAHFIKQFLQENNQQYPGEVNITFLQDMLRGGGDKEQFQQQLSSGFSILTLSTNDNDYDRIKLGRETSMTNGKNIQKINAYQKFINDMPDNDNFFNSIQQTGVLYYCQLLLKLYDISILYLRTQQTQSWVQSLQNVQKNQEDEAKQNQRAEEQGKLEFKEEQEGDIVQQEFKRKQEEEEQKKKGEGRSDVERGDVERGDATRGEGNYKEQDGMTQEEMKDIIKNSQLKDVPHNIQFVQKDQKRLSEKGLGSKNNFFTCILIENGKKIYHWVCIYSDGISLEYYDPYGEDPQQNIMQWLKENKYNHELQLYRKLKINKQKQQLDSSDQCGFFVLYFLLQRENDISFQRATHYKPIQWREEQVQNLRQNMDNMGSKQALENFSDQIRQGQKENQ